MSEIFEPFLAWPVLPSTVLVMLILGWSLLGLTGLFEMDLDVDTDLDFGDAANSLGGVTIRWLNLRDLPLVLWLGVFAFAWWTVSLVLWYAFDRATPAESVIGITAEVVRNVVIACAITKAITQPMTKWFRGGLVFDRNHLVGQTCAVWSLEATSTAGQGRMKTDAAPLLLNIRTEGEVLPKGSLARIVDYDPQRRIYIVTSATTEESP